MKTLATLVLGIGAIALAACGGSDSKSGATTTPAAITPNAAATTQATASSSASATQTTSTAASTATTAPSATATTAATTAPATAPTQSSAATAVPPTAVPPTQPAGAPASARVGLDDAFFRFAPASVTVAVGGTVTWSWAGDTFHDVTGLDFPNHSDTAKSGNLSVVFTAPGTYRYECTVHAFSGMSGTVVVR